MEKRYKKIDDLRSTFSFPSQCVEKQAIGQRMYEHNESERQDKRREGREYGDLKKNMSTYLMTRIPCQFPFPFLVRLSATPTSTRIKVSPIPSSTGFHRREKRKVDAIFALTRGLVHLRLSPHGGAHVRSLSRRRKELTLSDEQRRR